MGWTPQWLVCMANKDIGASGILIQLTPDVWQKTFAERIFWDYFGIAKMEPNQINKPFLLVKAGMNEKVMNPQQVRCIFNLCKLSI